MQFNREVFERTPEAPWLTTAECAKKPPDFSDGFIICGRWDLNSHVIAHTRSLVLLVCQFRHFRTTSVIIPSRPDFVNIIFNFCKIPHCRRFYCTRHTFWLENVRSISANYIPLSQSLRCFAAATWFYFSTQLHTASFSFCSKYHRENKLRNSMAKTSPDLPSRK